MSKTIKINMAIFSIMLFFMIVNSVYYYDDVFRSYWWYFGWSQDGRPFADLFYKSLLYFRSDSIPDIYPLPLIISSIVFIYSLTKAIENVDNDNKIVNSIAFTIFILNPFFISNLSFKYDGAFMLLSVAFSLIPFSFKSTKYFILSSVVCLVISLGMYQASINAYIGIASIIAFVDCFKHNGYRKSITRISASALCVLVSYIAYSLLIIKNIQLNANFDSYTQTIPLSMDGFYNLINNINSALEKIKLALNSGIILPVSLFVITSILSGIFYSFKHKSVWIIVFLILSMTGCFFSSFGVSVFGRHPIFVARIFIGFGAFIMLMPLICSYMISNKVNYILSSFMIIPLLCIFFASINASREEFKYQNNISLQIINDINHSSARDYDFIVIDGYSKKSSIATVNSKIFPVVGEIIPPIFTNRYDGGVFTIMRNGLKNISSAEESSANLALKLSSKENIIAENNIYSINAVNNIIVLRFK